MKITWLGHSAFRLEESTGTAVVTDPYHSYVGFKMPRVTADIVTMSHSHNDHNNLQAVLGDPEVISAAGAYNIRGVHILARRTYHDSKAAPQEGKISFSNSVWTAWTSAIWGTSARNATPCSWTVSLPSTCS